MSSEQVVKYGPPRAMMKKGRLGPVPTRGTQNILDRLNAGWEIVEDIRNNIPPGIILVNGASTTAPKKKGRKGSKNNRP